jgi:hypothetical protein
MLATSFLSSIRAIRAQTDRWAKRLLRPTGFQCPAPGNGKTRERWAGRQRAAPALAVGAGTCDTEGRINTVWSDVKGKQESPLLYATLVP